MVVAIEKSAEEMGEGVAFIHHSRTLVHGDREYNGGLCYNNYSPIHQTSLDLSQSS